MAPFGRPASCASSSPDGWTGRQAGLREQRLLQAAAGGASQTPPQMLPRSTPHSRCRRLNGHGCSPAAQHCPSSLSSSGPHLSRASCGQRQPSAPVPCGQAWKVVSDRAWTGVSASWLADPPRQSACRGIHLPDGHGYASSARLPTHLQCVAGHAHSHLGACPMAAAVVAWMHARWSALTMATGPPHSADLFLL